MDALVHTEGADPAAEVSLVFCEDPFIHQLNRDYRGYDKPTDVLSFPQEGEQGLLGDVVISVPTCQRQARLRGHRAATEIEWMFLHGCLHLLGYDDETEDEAEEMSARAVEVYKFLGETAPATVPL